MKNLLFNIVREEVEVRSEPPKIPPKESPSPVLQPPFGGICNSAAHHNRISNSTMIQSGNTIAAQQGKPLPSPNTSSPPLTSSPRRRGSIVQKKTF